MVKGAVKNFFGFTCPESVVASATTSNAEIPLLRVMRSPHCKRMSAAPTLSFQRKTAKCDSTSTWTEWFQTQSCEGRAGICVRQR